MHHVPAHDLAGSRGSTTALQPGDRGEGPVAGPSEDLAMGDWMRCSCKSPWIRAYHEYPITQVSVDDGAWLRAFISNNLKHSDVLVHQLLVTGNRTNPTYT